jgi:hypothetical protein
MIHQLTNDECISLDRIEFITFSDNDNIYKDFSQLVRDRVLYEDGDKCLCYATFDDADENPTKYTILYDKHTNKILTPNFQNWTMDIY